MEKEMFVVKDLLDEDFCELYSISDMKEALLNIWEDNSSIQNEIEKASNNLVIEMMEGCGYIVSSSQDQI